MDFLDELRFRDLIQDFTPGLEEHLSEGLAAGRPVIAYIGFDPTAPSLTIGNYVPIMLLKLFQLSGHQPVMLFGGATGRIGDPSGKSEERTLMSAEEIATNLAAQRAQAEALFTPAAGCRDVIFIDNYDFYQQLNVLDFLRDVGKTLTVNYMMSKDAVKRRLETGISFTEFSYQLLQGYDFECLYRDHGVTLQMGGSDQWGNITSGIEFVRRNLGEKAFGLTVPLLTKADGSKFGKSERGNLWLNPELTSPYQFYQFWINADDRDLERYIRIFSLTDRAGLTALLQLAATHPREAKAALAAELTERIHGAEALESVQAVAELLFGRASSPEQLRRLSVQQLRMVAQEIPTTTVATSIFWLEGVSLIDLLSEHTTLVSSKSDARRAITNNAVSVNRVKVGDVEARVRKVDLLHDSFVFVENGKKNKMLLEAI